jgi:hypothetical protein
VALQIRTINLLGLFCFDSRKKSQNDVRRTRGLSLTRIKICKDPYKLTQKWMAHRKLSQNHSIDKYQK